jgi:hypothetical protein
LRPPAKDLDLPERDLGQNAAEQGDLELVERIERETAALDPLLAPLGRFSSLCRAMSASMPPAVRSAAGALAAPRRFPSLRRKVPGAARRLAGAGETAVFAFGPEMLMGRVSRPLPEADPGASSAGRGVREPGRSWLTRR